MLEYNQHPLYNKIIAGKQVASFISPDDPCLNSQCTDSFSKEWKKFNSFSEEEILKIGNQYFDIVNDQHLSDQSIVLDLGCGSGRWSRYLCDRVKYIEAIDPNEALFLATLNNADKKNIRFSQASIGNIPFADESFDFIMCIGVLHHLPDPKLGLELALKKLKKNGHLLLYVYYNLENRTFIYRILFKLSDLLRKIISSLPFKIKSIICEIITFCIYLPLKGLSLLFKTIFSNNWYKKIPLSYYHDKSYLIMRNDALDRFGTATEHRFSRKKITQMLNTANLTNIAFSEKEPYWHVIAQKK